MKASDIALFEKHGIDPSNPPWCKAYFVRFNRPGCIVEVKAVFSEDGENVIQILKDGSVFEGKRERDDGPFDGHVYATSFDEAKITAIGHLHEVIGSAKQLLESARAAKVVEC